MSPPPHLPSDCSALSHAREGLCPANCFPVRKEVTEFYQYTTRNAQESQPECVQEVMSATRDGRGPPHAALGTRRQKEPEAFWEWSSLASYDHVVDPVQVSI